MRQEFSYSNLSRAIVLRFLLFLDKELSLMFIEVGLIFLCLIHETQHHTIEQK